MSFALARFLPLLLLPALRAQELGVAEPVAIFPASVLPHCLYGFDPHDQAVQPWPKGPVPEGYRLEPSSRLHLLSQLGFEPDDVAVSVNGFALGTAERHYQARRGVQDALRCRWEVRRGEGTVIVEAAIQPGSDPELVVERDRDGLAVVLSREALWARLSSPYAFGRYPSMLAMSADDGVYAIDKGLVGLMRDLGFERLDHHQEIDGVALHGGRDMLQGLERLLEQPTVRWKYRRRGELRTRVVTIRGDAVKLRDVPGVQEPEDLEFGG